MSFFFNVFHAQGQQCMWLSISLFLVVLNSCAVSGNQAPGILSIQDQQLATNRSFQLDVTAYDEDSDPIEFEFNLSPPPPTLTLTSGGIPSLQKVSDYNAIFSWTPGNADVGDYALTLIVKDNHGNQTLETINLEVIDMGVGGGEWGRFIEPVGEAAVLNLDETSCFETNVVVQADQLAPEELNVVLAPPSPTTASLISNGFKSYRLTWCPQSQETTNQVNFPFIFKATTTRGFAPIEKRFLVRLRSTSRSDCPGSAPNLNHQTLMDYQGVNNLKVELEVTDDIGVKSAPTLFYQAVSTQLSTGPSPSDWTSVVMNGQGEDLSNIWTGVIPAVPLPEGAIIYYRFLVSDDDDPTGVACDHSVESEVFQVNYLWNPSLASIGAGLCEPCIDDIQCGGFDDRCLGTSGTNDGICAQTCDLNRACPTGYRCQEEVSINLVTSMQCVSENRCGLNCIPDRFDTPNVTNMNNNVEQQGSMIMSGFYDMLSICGGDQDYYLVDVPSGLTLTARIEFDHSLGDLDLRTRAFVPMENSPSDSSLTVSDYEEVVLSCVPNDMQALIEVFGYEGAQNQYTLNVTVDNRPCEIACEPDAFEVSGGNATTLNASFIDLNQQVMASICPQDIDVYGFEVEAGSRVEIRLDHDSNQSDLDLEILDEEDQRITFSEAQGRDVEILEFTPNTTAEYYVKVYHQSGMGNVSYTLTVRGGSSLCSQSLDCDLGKYCDGTNSCISNSCDARNGCDSGHVCVSPIAGRLPTNQNGLCTASCTSSSQCRTGESCKAFENFTKRCAPSGTAQIGATCSSFEDCAGNLICLPAPGGYCAVGGCRSNQDCSGDALCETIQNLPACLKRCNTDADCARSDLYCRDFTSGRACAP